MLVKTRFFFFFRWAATINQWFCDFSKACWYFSYNSIIHWTLTQTIGSLSNMLICDHSKHAYSTHMGVVGLTQSLTANQHNIVYSKRFVQFLCVLLERLKLGSWNVKSAHYPYCACLVSIVYFVPVPCLSCICVHNMHRGNWYTSFVI